MAKPEKRRFPDIERTPSGTWRARVRAGGDVLRGKVRPTQREAFEDAEKLRAKSAGATAQRGVPMTVREAFDAVDLDCRRRNRRPQTRYFYRSMERDIAAYFGSDRKLASLTVDDVQGFVDGQLQRGNGAVTVRTRLRALRRAFLIAGVPSIGLRQLVVPDIEPPAPDAYLTLAEVRSLLHTLANAPADPMTDGDFFVVGLFVLSGARRAEVARMQKADVQPDRVLIRHGKKRPREIPLPDDDAALALVEGLQALQPIGPGSEWLVPGGTEAARIAWLDRMAKRVQLVLPKATMHKLRAAMATVLAGLEPPVPIPVVAYLLGHQATTAMGITGLYARPAPAAVRTAVGRLWVAVVE